MTVATPRTLAAACAALLLGSSLAAGLVPAAAATSGPVPVVATGDAAATTGPAPTEPYLAWGRTGAGTVAGRVIVDGTRRVPVSGHDAQLIGQQGKGYVVLAGNRLLRLARDGRTRTLAEHVNGTAVLSQSGRLAAISNRGGSARREHPVRVVDTRSGKLLDRREIRGGLRVLAVDRASVIVGVTVAGGGRGDTVRWDRRTGRVTRLVHQTGTLADLVHDRLALRTAYPEACTIVTRISSPRLKAWKECGYAAQVDSFGPRGQSMTLGPGTSATTGYPVPTLRDGSGRPVAAYDTPPANVFAGPRAGQSGYSRWEGDQVMVADVTPAGVGLSRCSPVVCERAGDVAR